MLHVAVNETTHSCPEFIKMLVFYPTCKDLLQGGISCLFVTSFQAAVAEKFYQISCDFDVLGNLGSIWKVRISFLLVIA